LWIDALRVALAGALLLAALAAPPPLLLPVLPLARLAASLAAGVGLRALFDTNPSADPDGQPAPNQAAQERPARRSLRHRHGEIVELVRIHY
jgi:hypothetical protein